MFCLGFSESYGRDALPSRVSDRGFRRRESPKDTPTNKHHRDSPPALSGTPSRIHAWAMAIYLFVLLAVFRLLLSPPIHSLSTYLIPTSTLHQQLISLPRYYARSLHTISPFIDMPSNIPLRPNAETVLLFGSQALDFDQQAFRQLSNTVVNSPNHAWALRAIDDLADVWETICSEIPSLHTVSGAAHLSKLPGWFRSGRLETTALLPNILLSPLVVITQLTQYATFAALREKEALPPSETVGFCIGLLSAFAVSASGRDSEFERYAAAATRVALLVGALVDREDREDPTTTVAVAWKAPKRGEEELASILKSHPGVRTSSPFLTFLTFMCGSD